MNWDEMIQSIPGAHFLQTQEWAQVKSGNDWLPFYKRWPEGKDQPLAAAMILQRQLTLSRINLPARLLYVARGPMLDWKKTDFAVDICQNIADFAKKQKAIFIRMEPEITMARGFPGDENWKEQTDSALLLKKLQQAGWRKSNDHTQFKSTVWLDISRTEEEILAGMKQKTRYNIRLAERKGVTIRHGDLNDIPLLYQMFAHTARRDGFVIRPPGYYENLWKIFFEKDMASFLIAECEQKPLAGLILFYFGGRAWYFFGMSLDEGRERMPNHLLQWEAIHLAKEKGCILYDMWGAPSTTQSDDLLASVYRFKEGFNGEVIHFADTLDFPVYPALYTLYSRIMPRVLNRMRRRGLQLQNPNPD